MRAQRRRKLSRSERNSAIPRILLTAKFNWPRFCSSKGAVSEAAHFVQDAAAAFEKQNMSEAGCQAQAVLSSALLAQAKVREAQAAAARATELCLQDAGRTSRFEAQFAIAAVRGQAGNFGEAFKILETVRSGG